MPDIRELVKTIFGKALELQSADEQEKYLEEACGDDIPLRAEVEDLLRATDRAGDFLRNESPLGPTIDMPVAEKPGTRIGPYKLREKIGEGGFGVVYVAEQEKPVARKVALKIIKPGMDTKDVIARFEAERQALAVMDHPNVAKVLDAGATDSGRPFFVMELVHGVSITEFCDEQKRNTRERLQIFNDVCRAVQHAHQKGIIHRDLKPSNVMVTLHDDKPVVKVIDFGVSKALASKLTEKTVYTAYGQMVGTPLYMSPEQAQFSGLDVDTRSDVYSLGVLLYELLTGTTPFDKETLHKSGFDEMRRIICEVEPPRPSARISTLNENRLSTVSGKRRIVAGKLSHSLRGELDWIVLMALQKDRNQRYESVSAFAADVERFLNDEAVQARPPSVWYRLRKIARRNKKSVTTTVLVSICLLIGTAATSYQAVRATEAERNSEERLVSETEAKQAALRDRAAAKTAQANAETARQEAIRQRKIAEQRKYHSDMRVALSHIKNGTFYLARDVLNSYIARKSEKDLRGWEWHYLWTLIHQSSRTISSRTSRFAKSSSRNVNLAWSPDGEQIAAVTTRGTIEVWNVKFKTKKLRIRGKRKSRKPEAPWYSVES